MQNQVINTDYNVSEIEDQSYFTSEDNANTAVVLLQMGGPYTNDLVEPFLYNLFSDRDIIRLPFFLQPFQGIIAKRISTKRAIHVRKLYQAIGGGSPIFQHTAGLAKELYEILQTQYGPIATTLVMRYSKPRADETIRRLMRAGIERGIIFPLYPHYSAATNESSINDFKQYAKKLHYQPELITVDDWGCENFYINWWKTEIANEIQAIKKEFGDDPKYKPKILFSVHGLPKRYITAGDPYQKNVVNATNLIMEDFKEYDWMLAFQSRVGPVEWLQPYTPDALKTLADGKSLALIINPLGFVSDHLETLQEIDMLYRSQAIDLGFKVVRRVKVPNASPIFAQGIVDLLLPRLR